MAPLTTTFIWLQHQKSIVRREVKRSMIAGLDKEELVLLKLTEEEKQEHLRWEHSKEFEYNNQMYDIVEVEIKGDTTYYTCWSDYKETKLNKQLDKLLAKALGRNPQRRETKKRLSKLFKSLYHNETAESLLTFSQTVQKVSVYGFSCISFSSSPPVPPPEIG